jgi:hypothetical protein
MSFCTGCGNNVNPASKFCDKCGKPVSAMSAQPGASAAAAPAPAQVAQPVPVQKSGGLLKPLLIIFGVIALLAVLAIAGMVGFGIFIAKQAKIHQTEGGGAKIETPFGNIEADDPAKTAEKMGIDVYPGAEAVKNGAGSISMGDFSAGTATFETTDSVDQVAAFYKDQYPRAVHSESNGTHSFSVNSKDKMVVITMQSTGSKTTINLAQVIAPKSRSRD